MVAPSILPLRVSAQQPISETFPTHVFLVGILLVVSVSNFLLLRCISEEMKIQNEVVAMKQKLEALQQKQHGAATATASAAVSVTTTRNTSTLPDGGYDVLDVGSSKGKGKGSINLLSQAVSKLRLVETDAAQRLDDRTLGLN